MKMEMCSMYVSVYSIPCTGDYEYECMIFAEKSNGWNLQKAKRFKLK